MFRPATSADASLETLVRELDVRTLIAPLFLLAAFSCRPDKVALFLSIPDRMTHTGAARAVARCAERL